MKKWVVIVAGLLILFAAIFGLRFYLTHRAAAGSGAYPPTVVSTAVARAAAWGSELRVVGSLRAIEGTDITAQLAGNVTAISFRSGAPVQKGQLLVQLDNSTQLAALKADEARLKLAEVELKRAQALYERQFVSQQNLQTAETNVGVARAAVDSDRALLAKLRITAPFSGVVGIRQVSLGQYVSPGTPIVNLQRWDPLFLDFSLPQDGIGRLKPGQPVSLTVDAWPGETFDARVTAIGAEVDPDTRNIAVQATLANATGRLRPGMFGHVTLGLGESLSGVEVPHAAISFSTFGNNVYVVSSDKESGGKLAHARVVTILAQRGGLALLEGGAVKAGEVVVTAGQTKLRDGAPVTIDNSVQP